MGSCSPLSQSIFTSTYLHAKSRPRAITTVAILSISQGMSAHAVY